MITRGDNFLTFLMIPVTNRGGGAVSRFAISLKLLFSVVFQTVTGGLLM